jgi:hypothetical protein
VIIKNHLVETYQIISTVIANTTSGGLLFNDTFQQVSGAVLHYLLPCLAQYETKISLKSMNFLLEV